MECIMGPSILRVDDWGKGAKPVLTPPNKVEVKGVPGDANGAGVQVNQASIKPGKIDVTCQNKAAFDAEWYGPAGWQITTSGKDSEDFKSPTCKTDKQCSIQVDVAGKAYYKIKVSPGTDIHCEFIQK